MDIARLDRKRKSLELAAAAMKEGKLCLICNCGVTGNADVCIFLIDLASHGDVDFVDKSPALRLDLITFGFDAYCVLDWKLYMFESCLVSDGCHIAHRTSVFMLDLSTIIHASNLRLKKTDLNPGPAMSYPKSNPLATPTPDGKGILVFSSQLNSSYEVEDGDLMSHEIDFELYVPGDGSWTQLPGVPREWGDSFPVLAFTFFGKSEFLLNTGIGWLALDLESLSDGWRRAVVGAEWRDYRGGGSFFVSEEDGLSLTPWGVYDRDRLFCFHGSSFGDCDYKIREYRQMALVDDDDGGRCNFCIMQTATIGSDYFPHLIVDVCSCDLAKYREDKKRDKQRARVETRVDKSFKIILASRRCTSVKPVDLFYLGPRPD